MSYKLCCDTPKVVAYSLYHSPMSSSDLAGCLELLLYLPEVDSFQSTHGTVFTNDVYEPFFLSETKRLLDMTDDDFEIDNSRPDRTIDDTIAHFYEGNLCLNCSKIYIAQCKGKNKIISLFVRIRDMIAHGYFNLVDDVFIGFDHPRFASVSYSGVVKVPLKKLRTLLYTFISIEDTPSLFKYIIKRSGYKVYDSTSLYSPDLLIEKNGRKYFLQFKSFVGRYIEQNDLVQYIRENQHIDKRDCMFVLIVDSTYTSSRINSILLEHNICILDKDWIKELMNGEDIFEDLSRTVEIAKKEMVDSLKNLKRQKA